MIVEKIILIRHSIKGQDGELTPDGVLLAENYGKTLTTGYRDCIKIYTSDIQRSIDTGHIIYDQLETPFKPRIKNILSEFPYTDEKIEELNLNGGRWLLHNEDDELLPSTRFMAGKIASFILETGEIISKHKTVENLNVVAISHVPPLMCFLGYAIAFNHSKDFIDEDIKEELLTLFRGSFIKPLQGFEVIFSPSSNEYTILVSGKSFKIPLSFLESLIKPDQ